MIDIINNDIIGAIVFLLPGFLSIYIACGIIKFKSSHLKDPEYYLLSIFISIIAYALVYYYNNFTLDGIENSIINYTYLLELYAIAIIIGIFLGITIKKILYKNFHIDYGSPWTLSLKDNSKREQNYVHIFTSDNCEISGNIILFSDDYEKHKEITIDDPCIVVRDANYNIEDMVYLGQEMYFKEDDIKRIVFLEPESIFDEE
ncbi:hypothetical protein [Methanolobus sp. WCC4]|uniref:hypothetical protein n=1 Tax=Methanolobus sp. WCC4 TaxID=3125784 RepID=UPI0030FCA552